ncbi:hypothetical protein V8E52_005357 [Russula decolorans]
MGNCCSGTAMVPSTSLPRGTETTTPALVRSQPSTGKRSSVPSSKPLSRTRGRTTSKHESTHNRVSSQNSSPRSRTKSAPQAPKPSTSSSLQNRRTRAQSVRVMDSGLWILSDHCTLKEQLTPAVVPAPTKSNPSSGRSHTPTAARERGKMSRIGRSSTLRASRGDVSIQASIKAGQSGHWRRLWSRLDFADQPLKNCVNTLHVDIVKIWEQYDGNNNQYLSSDQFKINMSHVVKDLALSASRVSSSSKWNRSGDKFADWVYDTFRGSEENVRWLMGYIVDLHVILNEISKTATSNVTDDDALEVMNNHVRSDHRNNIHQEIRSFVTATFPKRFSDPTKDLFLEKIVELIREYCPGE